MLTLGQLICQPPVKVMRVSIDCCSNQHITYEPEQFSVFSGPTPSRRLDLRPTITSENGLTVGDLYDSTIKLRAEHLHCPHAREDEHLRDGTVDVSVSFEGEIELEQDDPYVVNKIKEATKASLKHIDQDSKRRRLGVYVRAKRTGELPDFGFPLI